MDINKANIANALHSVAREHVIATADEIYDNSREQYQNGVNEAVGRYVENPEFVCVYTDAEDRILWGIKADADIFYGTGVPTQLREYVEKKIEELSLDEYEDIVAFLDDFIGSDTTLKMLLDGLDGKMDAEAQRAEGVEEIISQRTNSIENKTSEISKISSASDDEEVVITTDNGVPVTFITAKKGTDDNDVVEFSNDSGTEVYAKVGVVSDKKGIFAQNVYDLNGNPIQAFEIDTENEVMIIGGRKYKLIPYVE